MGMLDRRTVGCIETTLLAAAAAILALGCSKTCTEEERDGLSITVRDGRTGTPLCDSTVVAFDGAYQDTLSNLGLTFPPCTYHGASERPGTYRVHISRPGYTSTDLTDLTVKPGECHIEASVIRTVDLEPDPDTAKDGGAD